MKKLICKLFGHKYRYNFGWMPSKCVCERCGMRWKTIKNPEYIAGESNPIETDLHTWVEDNSN